MTISEPLDLIMTRRSIRKYKPDKIPDEIIGQIIKAGTYAPSALALQPWAFIVVQNMDFMQKVSEYCKPIMISLMKDAHDGMSDEFRELLSSEGYSIYYHAPLMIMVIGKSSSRFREIDCSLCAENMMLAAHALGIGSCWIGSTEVAYDNPEIMAGFQIPEGYSPVGTIVFGYPDEKPDAHDKKSPHITWIR
ncbi:MAG TPA: nitroreductase family protein [Methanospirillum sp.]|uniref:nitroreductase family protein n=1 Tax=Methanospirillum sp. TaxID=45200 RepID=UPI002BC3E244|nr:nitroreductase family protein [Methanospirillum sp.]HWQ64211.1 nitroreductase family protein [Methanospirillum sp.]